MTSQNVAFMSMVLENKLDEPTKLFALKQCENLDDSAVSSLSAIKLKSPVTGLVLHCFLGLFGAGRFYKGNGVDIMVGLLYLGFFAFLCVLSAQGVITNDECGGAISLEIFVAWVDCYFIFKGIQKDNWQKLQNFFSCQYFKTRISNECFNAFEFLER